MTLNINFSPFRIQVETVTPAALAAINLKLDEILMKQSEFNAKVLELAPKFERIGGEIKEEIRKLRESDPDISPEGQAALSKMEAVGTALDELAPELPTEPPTP